MAGLFVELETSKISEVNGGGLASHGAFCTRGLRNDLSEKSGTGLTRKRNGEYQVRFLWRFQQMGPLCQVSG